MLTFGVVGTGWITDLFVECAHASKKWKLAAVYSRTEKTAREFGAKHSCERVHTSISALAHDAEVQVVYIASPNSLHYEQARGDDRSRQARHPGEAGDEHSRRIRTTSSSWRSARVRS